MSSPSLSDAAIIAELVGRVLLEMDAMRSNHNEGRQAQAEEEDEDDEDDDYEEEEEEEEEDDDDDDYEEDYEEEEQEEEEEEEEAHQDPAPAAPHRHLIAASPKPHDELHHNHATSPFQPFKPRPTKRCRQQDPPCAITKVDRKPRYSRASSLFVPIPHRATTKEKAPTHHKRKKPKIMFFIDLCDSSEDE